MDAQFFLDLHQAFEDQASIFTAAGVQPVAIIDRFRGQPQNPEQFEIFPLPAIFVQRSAAWTREGKTYKADWSLIFHTVYDATWETSSISTNKEEGLKYYTWLDKVREVLDNFSTAFTGTLFRTEDETIETGVVNYEALGYSCQYYGSTAIGTQYESHYPDDLKLVKGVKTRNA